MKINQQPLPLNILLADDDKDDRYFFEKALREIPILTSITCVLDGEQLMNYLFQNSNQLPDILFLDLNMPRKTGFECLAEIKENLILQDIPVVMFSTSYPRDPIYEQDMISRLLNIGALQYIRKPSDFGQFSRAIHQSLKTAIEKIRLTKMTN